MSGSYVTLQIAIGVFVPLLIAGLPALWRWHKWMVRIEQGLLVVDGRSKVVEDRSVQLTKNSGTHVADMPEIVRRIEAELRKVGSDAARAATSARASADLAVASSQVAVQAVQAVAGDVRSVHQMVTLHLAAGHKEHVEKKES